MTDVPAATATVRVPSVTPFLWLERDAAAAARRYAAIFPGSRVLESSAQSATLELAGQSIILFEGGPVYRLSAAFSLFVSCETQAEIDHYWDALLEGGGKPTRCGWLDDRFGVTWQVIPARLRSWIAGPDAAGAKRALEAMMGMQKLDIAALERAYAGA